MTLFLLIGALGLTLVLVSLVLGDLLDGIFEGFDFDAGGVFSTPVIGSFLSAFGFAAALILYGTGASTGVAALGGLAGGIGMGGVALLITRSLMSMATDEPIRSHEVVGLEATVVTRIPADGLGEVSLVHRGQLMKLSARSTAPVAGGASVTITAVTSPSSVVVAPKSPAE